jgi:tetratricopeptide (TPR) repeat protein
VILRGRLCCGILLAFLACLPPASAQKSQLANLDEQFQAALAEYNTGKFAEATAGLQALLRHVPESFDVHELLGMTYAAQSQNAKANVHLDKAVRLNPNSVAARSNLAANLSQLGKFDLAEVHFKRAVELEPNNFDTNHNLGESYVHAGKLKLAATYLERAQNINRNSYDNGYDLALSYLLTDRPGDARQLVHELLKLKDTAELHNLLGDIEEKDGQFVTAANEFEIAAHAEPSESNLFDWGSELLLHRTLDPAVEVFQHSAERYPTSARLTMGLGMALYARGNYDDAVKALLKAADMNPSDPNCYLFLSKAYTSSPAQADEVIARFQRFMELHPRSAQAHYYYAMSLWKGKRTQDASLNVAQIEALLKKSVALDPKFAEPHLQLGNLYSDQQKYADAIPEYVRAQALNGDLADIRYRLAQAYVHTGQKEKAQQQFAEYQKLREQHLAEIDRQRAEIRQFVYAAKTSPGSKAQ